MNSFSDLFLRENLGQLILCILFIVYLILGAKVPSSLASVIDTVYGKVIIVVIAIILFINSNPILGIIGFVVAFELLRRSTISTGSDALEKYLPTEKKKTSQLNAMNQFPYTLEQEIIKKMAPITTEPSTQTNPEFHPILDNLYDAAPISYTGII
jgi:hypothetical protein